MRSRTSTRPENGRFFGLIGLSAVLFVNPDRAGPRRFRLPVTLAYLTLGAAGLRARVVHLVPER